MIAVAEQRKTARSAVESRNPVSAEKKADGKAKSAHSSLPTRTAVAKESKLPERKIRLAQEIKKVDPKLSEMVRSGEVKLTEAKKLSVHLDQLRCYRLNPWSPKSRKLPSCC